MKTSSQIIRWILILPVVFLLWHIFKCLDANLIYFLESNVRHYLDRSTPQFINSIINITLYGYSGFIMIMSIKLIAPKAKDRVAMLIGIGIACYFAYQILQTPGLSDNMPEIGIILGLVLGILAAFRGEELGFMS